MAVPTIATITPNAGAPTGWQVVEITGTNFRLPTAAAANVIPVPVSPPSVRVSFGSVEAYRVDVVSDSRLFVVVPKYALAQSADAVVLNVTVENIDDAGVLIPGETVTAANAYTYARPTIAHTTSGDFIRAVIALADLLKSEVLANTVINTSVDYDPDTGLELIQVEATPQLILTGPTLRFNSFFTHRGSFVSETAAPTEVLRRRRHRVVDLEFEVMGVTNSDGELINLQSLLETVLDRNSTIDVLIDDADPTQGTLPLELHILESPTYERARAHSLSDLRSFSARFVLKGWPLNVLPGVANDAAIGVAPQVTVDPSLDSVLQTGDNLPVAQGAPTRSPPNSGVT